MSAFPAIEQYRAELLAMDFTPVDAFELARIRHQHAAAESNCAADELYPSDEQRAFTALMIELRVPRLIAEQYSDRFSRERIIGPALARQNERLAEGLPAWDGVPAKQNYTLVTWTDEEVAAYRRRWPNHPDPSL